MSSRPPRPAAAHHDSSSSSSSSSSSASSPYPVSDSDGSSSSASSGMVARGSAGSRPKPAATVEVLRCMRCTRTAEATSTDDIAASSMVRVGHNIYYCHHCAKLVGYQ